MKSVLTLELFGEDLRQQFKLYRGIFSQNGAEELFDKTIGMPPRSSWVAEICGPDEKYGLSRRFLRAKLDYSRSNGIGSRGIFAEYLLETGKIYEVQSQTTWKCVERYFCTVDNDGDIVKLGEDAACHAVGAPAKEERRVKKRAEAIS